MTKESDMVQIAGLFAVLAFSLLGWIAITRTSVDRRHTPEDLCGARIERLRASIVQFSVRHGAFPRVIADAGLSRDNLFCPVSREAYTLLITHSNQVRSAAFLIYDSVPHRGVRCIRDSDTAAATLNRKQLQDLLRGPPWASAATEKLKLDHAFGE